MRTAVAIFVGTGAAFLLRLRRQYLMGNLALAMAMCVVLACVHRAYATFYPILGSQPIADVINRMGHDGDVVTFDGQSSKFSSLGFYTGKPVYLLNGRLNNLWYGSLFPDAPNRFLDDAAFRQLWMQGSRVLLVTDNAHNASTVDSFRESCVVFIRRQAPGEQSRE